MKRIISHLRENWIGYGFETLAVLFGVLAAFALNDWNEQRKERLKEIELLTELRQNLEEDVSVIQNTIEYEQEVISRIERLVEHLENDLPYNDSLQEYIRWSNYLERFEINRSAYETLKSVGVEKLSSSDLKKNISSYYDVWVNHRVVIVDRLNVEQRESLIQYRRRFFVDYEGDYEKFQFNAARRDRFIINYLYGRIYWKRGFIQDICRPNIVQSQELITSINQELDRLQN